MGFEAADERLKDLNVAVLRLLHWKTFMGILALNIILVVAEITQKIIKFFIDVLLLFFID